MFHEPPSPMQTMAVNHLRVTFAVMKARDPLTAELQNQFFKNLRSVLHTNEPGFEGFKNKTVPHS